MLDKIAENLHEIWAFNRIQSGWTFALVRDDAKKQNPCLTSFERLPEQQRSFNITMAGQNLRTIIALGYHVGLADEDAEYKLRKLKLPRQYLMTNGYKPAPLDLTHVRFSDKMEELVEQLATNSHNVWATERIKQGIN
jgi:ryanodine receptor 1